MDLIFGSVGEVMGLKKSNLHYIRGIRRVTSGEIYLLGAVGTGPRIELKTSHANGVVFNHHITVRSGLRSKTREFFVLHVMTLVHSCCTFSTVAFKIAPTDQESHLDKPDQDRPQHCTFHWVTFERDSGIHTSVQVSKADILALFATFWVVNVSNIRLG